jgi:hypothetical protein
MPAWTFDESRQAAVVVGQIDSYAGHAPYGLRTSHGGVAAVLTKPRTVCFCQPVASTISARVTPLARFIIAMTSAFLLLRSAAGLQADFLAGLAFFVVFAFFAGFAPLVAFLGFASGWPCAFQSASPRAANGKLVFAIADQ